MSYDAADAALAARSTARRNGGSYTETVGFAVERDGAEVELTVVVLFVGADRSTGLAASAEIDEVRLGGAPWTGTLTAREVDDVLTSFND